jgi:transcription elongation factor Elf1
MLLKTLRSARKSIRTRYVGLGMLNYCPICNTKVKSSSQDKKGGTFSVDCYLCRDFSIELDCAQTLRRDYLCFNKETVKGKDSFDQNMKFLRDYISKNHNPLITNTLLESMPLLEHAGKF